METISTDRIIKRRKMKPRKSREEKMAEAQERMFEKQRIKKMKAGSRTGIAWDTPNTPEIDI